MNSISIASEQQKNRSQIVSDANKKMYQNNDLSLILLEHIFFVTMVSKT